MMHCNAKDVYEFLPKSGDNADVTLILSADAEHFYAVGDDSAIVQFLHARYYSPVDGELVGRVVVQEWNSCWLSDLIKACANAGLSVLVVRCENLKPPASIIETNEDDKPAEASTEQQSEPALV